MEKAGLKPQMGMKFMHNGDKAADTAKGQLRQKMIMLRSSGIKTSLSIIDNHDYIDWFFYRVYLFNENSTRSFYFLKEAA